MKKASMFVLMFMFIMSSIVFGAEDELIFNLKDGEEYMDKTFVYDVASQDGETVVKALCAEMDAPTYDVKKGLMTWVDYKTYDLEEIFDEDAAIRIRAIFEIAGPHLSQEEVITYLEERTGIVNLTYDEVISAVQYAIWFYSDDDFRIPSTSNGEDLYKYFVTLPGVEKSNVSDEVILNVSEPVKNEEDNVIEISFNFTSEVDADLDYSYSENIVREYNVKEQVTVENGITYVKLSFPIITEEVTIDFDVEVSGTLDEVNYIVALAPEEIGSSQMLVAMVPHKNSERIIPKSKNIAYKSFRLILDDDGDKTRTSHTSGEYLSLEDIENINQTGKSGYTFIGWFDEGNIGVSEGITMNMNRYLIAIYNKNDDDDDTDNDDDSDNDDTGNDDDSDDDDTNNDDDSDSDDTGNDDDSDGDDTNNDDDSDSDDTNNDDDSDSDDTDNDDGSDSDNTDNNDNTVIETIVKNDTTIDQGNDLVEENLPDEDIPTDNNPLNWIPKTGGIPILVFLMVGLVSVGIGFYVRRR